MLILLVVEIICLKSIRKYWEKKKNSSQARMSAVPTSMATAKTGTVVFVRNLSFKSPEAEVESHFSQVY